MNNSTIEAIHSTVTAAAPAATHSPTANPKAATVGTFLPTTSVLEPRVIVLRRFLQTILPEQGSIYFAVTLPRKDSQEGPRHYVCRTIDELADRLLALDGAGAETYFATASYKQERFVDSGGKARQRCRENVESIRACWLDIDVSADKGASGDGYATQSEALRALTEFSTKLGFEPSLVISSGRGLHVYYAFQKAVAPAEWKLAAHALKHACALAGLRADGSRTEDAASILRPLGCMHRKDPAHPRRVSCLAVRSPVEFARLSKAVREFVGTRRGNTHIHSSNPQPAWSVGSPDVLMPRAAKILTGLVDNDDLSAGIHETHPWLHDLSPDDQFRLLEDACGAIPAEEWSRYESWQAIIAGFRGLHHLDEERLLAVLQRYSEKSPKWEAGGWNTARLRDKFRSFRGGSVRRIFELAEAHGWNRPGSAILSPFSESATAESYFVERFVYVKDQAGYLDTKSRRLISAVALDESQSWLTTNLKTTPRQLLKRSAKARRADSLGYNPGADATYDENGQTFANLYVPWAPTPLDPTAQEQEIWDWFIYAHLFRRPEDHAMREYFLNALAYPLQNPGRRVASFPLLIGEEYGSGKSTLMERVPRLMYGDRNVTVATQSEIESGFNDWQANHQIVCFPEVWIGGRDAKKIANDLKDKITNDVLRVYPKGLKGYSQPNRATLLGTSNYEDAVHLRDGDRRWGIHITDAQKMTAGESASLYAFLNSYRAPGVLQQIFRNRDLSSFNPAGEPPMSEGKTRVISASRSPIEAEIVEMLQDREPPLDRDLFVFEWLIDCLRNRIPDIEKFAPRRLAEYVQRKPIAAVRLDGRKRIKAGRSVDGVGSLRLDGKHGVWCTGNLSIWASASDKEISRHLEDGSPPLAAVADSHDSPVALPPEAPVNPPVQCSTPDRIKEDAA